MTATGRHAQLDASSDPFVSIIMPCYNEAGHITACLESLLANDYDPAHVEILVVDGMSMDGTREILARFQSRYNNIRLIDNPARNTPRAMNLGVAESRGEVIVRVDAHSVYASNYISTLSRGLARHQADNVGGIRRTALVTETALTLALSLAISNPFTAGNTYYRIGSDRVREVDTVFCGCWQRKIFDQIGFMNERFNRAQDREFNARLHRRGGRIVLDPSTSCTYYPRTSLGKYAKWNALGAFYLFYNHQFTDLDLIHWRNLVPAALASMTIVAAIAVLFRLSWGAILAAPVLLYAVVATILAGALAVRYRRPALWPAMLLVFVVTHFGYGLGTLAALPWYLFRRGAHPYNVFSPPNRSQ